MDDDRLDSPDSPGLVALCDNAGAKWKGESNGKGWQPARVGEERGMSKKKPKRTMPEILYVTGPQEDNEQPFEAKHLHRENRGPQR